MHIATITVLSIIAGLCLGHLLWTLTPWMP